ncbi:MAG: FtsX-like permease family protein [Deltaproteobacteria bacterium]|nr:FtsX-like permease family protein [Deltaproteobacteria bacterium]
MNKTLIFLARHFWWRHSLPRSVRIMRGMVLIGITLSVATLVVTLSVTAGFEHDYKKALLDFNAHVILYPGEGKPYTEEIIRKALDEAHLKDVVLLQVSPFLYREALLIHEGVIKGVVLKGIDLPKVGGGVVLGEALAEKLGWTRDHGPWTMDQTVKLLIPEGKEVSAKNTKRLKVSDTFRSGLYEFDSQFALIDLAQLQDLFHLPRTYFGFELKINRPELAPLVATALEEKLGPEASIQNWIELNGPLFQALELEKWAFKILMGLMVFVSALNLIGIVLLMIFRKRKAIAMLQALGLASKQVRDLFAGQGFVLGVLGVLLGILAGILFVLSLKYFQWIPLDPQIYFVGNLPVQLEGSTVFIIAIFGLLLVWQISWLAASRLVTVPIREGLHGPG